MSVINQVLLDLEKRRASFAERGAVPDHVRALPDEVRAVPWGWIAGGIAAIVMAAVAWVLLAGSSVTRATQPATRTGAEAVIEKVVTASAGVPQAAAPADSSAAGPASRLTFELSNVPESVEMQRVEQPVSGRRAAEPVPTERVIGRADPEPAPREAPAAKTRIRPETSANEKAARVAGAADAQQPDIKKQVNQPSARELAENEYRKATVALNQGKMTEAQEGVEAALNQFPAYHAARQALVGVFVETKKLADAERVLQDGLTLAPAQIGFAMALARLQIDRGDSAQAAATLRKGLDYAQGSPDYIAFYGAVLQRLGQHEEAIEQFQAALRAKPGAGVWWLGLGISLQASSRAPEAQDAFRRARATNSLSPELAAFADQRLKQLQ